MATWADVVAKQNQLIRKALDAELFLAPISAAVPTTIMDPSGGPKLPTGFGALGHHTDDGLTWGRETEASDVASHGSVEPSRSDIRRITRTLQVTAQETNRLALEAQLGISLGAVTPGTGATGGEITFQEPDRPKSVYYRLLALAVDDADDGEIYFGRLYTRAKVTETGEEVWSDGDQALQRQMTFQSYKDDAAGFSVRHFFGGPGWVSLLEAAGFDAAV